MTGFQDDEALNPQHDVLVDCLDLRCPMPVLKARKALQRAQPGDVVRVDSSDPMAVLDIPHMVRAEGHEVTIRQIEGDRSRFWIRRGSASDMP